MMKNNLPKLELDFSILRRLDGKAVASTATIIQDNGFVDGVVKNAFWAETAVSVSTESTASISSKPKRIKTGVRRISGSGLRLLSSDEVKAMFDKKSNFVKQHREELQGAGLLECKPSEWEKDDVAVFVERMINDCDSDNAADNTVYEASYSRRISKCFRDAYDFFAEHKHIRTIEDLNNIKLSLGACANDPFTVGLISECLREFEREYDSEAGASIAD